MSKLLSVDEIPTEEQLRDLFEHEFLEWQKNYEVGLNTDQKHAYLYGTIPTMMTLAKANLRSLVKEMLDEVIGEDMKVENMGDTFKVNWARGYNSAKSEQRQRATTLLDTMFGKEQ